MEESGLIRNMFLKYNSYGLLVGWMREGEWEREENTAPGFLVGMVGKSEEVQKVKFGFGYVSFEISLKHLSGDVKETVIYMGTYEAKCSKEKSRVTLHTWEQD